MLAPETRRVKRVRPLQNDMQPRTNDLDSHGEVDEAAQGERERPEWLRGRQIEERMEDPQRDERAEEPRRHREAWGRLRVDEAHDEEWDRVLEGVDVSSLDSLDVGVLDVDDVGPAAVHLDVFGVDERFPVVADLGGVEPEPVERDDDDPARNGVERKDGLADERGQGVSDSGQRWSGEVKLSCSLRLAPRELSETGVRTQCTR